MARETVLNVLKEIRDLLKGTVKAVAAATPGGKRFENLPDGWIRDHREKKEWGPSSERILNEEERKEFCTKLGGEEPTVAEAASIINYEGDPAFFPIFADTKTDNWYATRSVPAWSKSYVRIVGYSYGDVGYYSKDHGYYVRPVRPASD